MDSIDQAILERLGTAQPAAGGLVSYFLEEVGVTVYDGWFDARPALAEKVVDFPMPYANYLSSFGDDDKRRLDGRTGQREMFFRLYVVGDSRKQVKWAVQRLRNRVEGFRPVVDGLRLGRVLVDSAPLITRDDDALLPDGRPMFYAVDAYTIRSSIRRAAWPHPATP